MRGWELLFSATASLSIGGMALGQAARSKAIHIKGGRFMSNRSLGPFGPRARIVALLAGLMLLAGAASAAGADTDAVIYSPFTKAGQPASKVAKKMSGSCGDGSALVPHKNAWTCQAGKTYYDACFAFKLSSRSVLCLAKSGPWSELLEIKLTRRLPSQYANDRTLSPARTLPWAVETASGLKCLIVTSAGTKVDGKQLDYFCPGSTESLWGLTRKGKLWKVFVAPARSKKLSKQVGVRDAWF
jgi:ribosomal protein S27AE